MANHERGEIEVKGIDGAQYVFRLTTNAICALEDAVGKSALELCEDLRVGKVTLKTLRTFVKVASTGKDLSDDDAGDRVDQIGALPLIGGLTNGLLRVFGVSAGSKRANPRKPTSDATTGAGDSNMPPK